jgi:hypothetical protein
MKNLAFTQYHLWEWCGKGYRLKKKKGKTKEKAESSRLHKTYSLIWHGSSIKH